MAKRTINAKEILVDIKAGMDNAALMEKYQLSEKGLQSLFKKLVDAGVLKQREQDIRPSEPEKVVEAAWKCSQCGKTQPKPFDQCPECGKIGSRVKTELSEPVGDFDSERRKFLYELARDEFDRVAADMENTDKKIANSTPVLGLLLGASGYFGNWVLQAKILPPQSSVDWFILILLGFAFTSNLLSWSLLFKTLTWGPKYQSALLGDDLVNFFLERTTETVHTGFAYRFARDAQMNKDVVNHRTRLLGYCYYNMVITAFVLASLSASVAAHSWINSQPAADWNGLWFFLE